MDPLAEQTMDPYGYCYNNPINLVDPTGMSPESLNDIGELNVDTGELKIIKNNEIDRMYLVDKNGNRIKDGAGNDKFYQMEYDGQIKDAVEGRKSDIGTGVYSGPEGSGDEYLTSFENYEFNNADKAQGFFEFLADNSNTKNEFEFFKYSENGIEKGMVGRTLQFEELITVENGRIVWIMPSVGYKSVYKDLAVKMNNSTNMKPIEYDHSHPFDLNLMNTLIPSIADENSAYYTPMPNMNIYSRGTYSPLKSNYKLMYK